VGDIFHDRKIVNLNGLNYVKKYFFDKFDEYGIKMITILGNHDIYHKNTLEINSPSLILREYKNIEVIDVPKEITLFDSNILMLPWICNDNCHQSMKAIEDSKSDICFGHLELNGFYMHRGMVCDHGMNYRIFDKFHNVISGHFHTMSHNENIKYVGIPCELTWQDCDDPKGFHIFDLHSRKFEFIQNPYKMFNRIVYDDVLNEDQLKTDIEQGTIDYSNSYVKVIVKNKNNPYLFYLFIETLNKNDVLELNIIEDLNEVFEEEMEMIDETEDTVTILSKYIDGINTKSLNSNKLKVMVTELYNDAISLEI
jgi:DNA repair exonuclease SbcCD nuclease subunit